MDEQEFLKARFKSAVSSTVKAISGNFDLKIQWHIIIRKIEIPPISLIMETFDLSVPFFLLT